MSRHIVVIGAGAVGAMCAIQILRDGDRVTLVEPETPGGEQAASYGNSGWLSTHSVIPPSEPGVLKKTPGYLLDPLGPLAIRWSYLPTALPWLLRYAKAGATRERLAVTAHALRGFLADAPGLHEEVAQVAGVGHLIERAGLMHVFPSRDDFAAASLAWGLRREVGVTWEELDAAEISRREPALDRRYRFALVVKEGGHCINPGAYVAGLVSYAGKAGAVRKTARATGFRIEGGRLRAVVTDQGDLACDGAVIAAGGRSRPLAVAAGDRVSLEVERGYHVMIARPEGAPRTPMMTSDSKVVAVAMQEGLRIGGQVEIAAFDAAPNWKRAQIVRDHALRMFPDLPRELPEDRVRYWLGRRPSTPDGLPCIGRARASGDIVHAFGHGHVGLSSSARTGRLVAQLLAGRSPEVAIEAFDPRRFER